MMHRSPPASVSTPNLTAPVGDESDENITCRQKSQKSQSSKRKWVNGGVDELSAKLDEMKELLSKTSLEQEQKLLSLHVTISEIKTQNEELNKNVQFMSAMYDEVKAKLTFMDKERKEAFSYIKQLESKVESLEKNARSGSIEVRNVPKKHQETKNDLINIVQNIGTCVSTPIAKAEIRDIFRVNSKGPSNNTIIVELTSVLKKEDIINSIKSYKKNHNELPTTQKINMDGPPLPIYISENLSSSTKRLYALARAYAKENGYKFCWTAHGHVYIRKKEGDAACRIQNEETLVDLKKTL